MDVDLADYPRAKTGSDPALVKALQCLLLEQKVYAGKVTGTFSAKTLAAVQDWQRAHDLAVRPFVLAPCLDDAAGDRGAAGAQARVDRVRPSAASSGR